MVGAGGKESTAKVHKQAGPRTGVNSKPRTKDSTTNMGSSSSWWQVSYRVDRLHLDDELLLGLVRISKYEVEYRRHHLTGLMENIRNVDVSSYVSTMSRAD